MKNMFLQIAFWILTVGGAIFYTHELTLMSNEKTVIYKPLFKQECEKVANK